MTISSPGIGSNLDVSGIVSKLMQVESQPMTTLAAREATYQAKISSFGSLSGALATFQSALLGLSTPTKFQSVLSSSSDQSIVNASATSKAVVGSYSVNVSQLAQAQTISTSGKASATATIGSNVGSTTVNFQFGTVAGGNFIKSGTALSAAVASSGIVANSLSINGTAIVTSGATNNASALATQINLLTSTTGVTATAQTTDTGALGAFTTTSGAATYTLDVGGVNIITNGAIGTTAADLDIAVTAAAGSLTTAGIAYTGTAALGTLKFTKADGTNIAIQESGSGAIGGLTTTVGATTKTFTGAVSLSSSGAIAVTGSNALGAGLTVGSTYSGATFTQDATQSSGSVTIDSTNNSLQGIRDAINSAGIGVTASIVSDGSATPNHLVVTSNKTGATASMKISVTGDADIGALLAYDPAGTQNMTQSTAAQSVALSVNGLAVSGNSNTVTEAIQGVTLNVSKIGTATVSVSNDAAGVTASVNAFVKAFNDVNKTIQQLTAYDPVTKIAGPLLGNASVRAVQTGIRNMLTTAIPELSGSSLSILADVGVTVQKDSTLAIDAAKLQSAITNHLKDVGGLFAAIGKASDSLINVVGSTSATKPGNYAVNVTTLATKGTGVGSTAAGLTITADVNDTLIATIDGVAATIKLVPATYASYSALSSQIQSAINGSSAFTTNGNSVDVSATGGGIITVTSNRYGSASKVSFGGNAANNLFGGAPVSTDGIDVAGTINGIAGTGSGQTLTGVKASAVEGLALEITGGSTGSRGTVNFSQGYAFRMNTLVNSFLGSTGLLSQQTDGLKSSIKDIGKRRDAFTIRLGDIEARYRKQFTALDIAMGQMSQTSSYLTQQLTAISNLSKQ